MLTIAFDGICLADRPITGVGRAFLNALAAYAADTRADCVLLLPDGADDPGLAGVRAVAAPRGALRRQRQLPRLLRSLRADVLHSSVAAIPLRAPCATIATAHDLPWLADAAEAGSGERSSPWRRTVTRRCLRTASAVIVPSTFTYRAAARITDDSRLVLIPHGSERVPIAPAADDRRGPLLALGDDRPRKNRGRLRHAHALAARRSSAMPELRFVGPPHDYVDEAEKARLLATCTAVVQVSCFEGFGLPVLEALAAAAPLLCADIPPFREVAGDAARFVDPRDAAAIAVGLLELADPAVRSDLAMRGYERAARFAPSATARRWAELHRRVAGA